MGKEVFEKFLRRLKARPALAIAIGAVALIVFLLLLGAVFAAAAIACAFAVLLLFAVLRRKQPGLRDLFSQKKELLDEIKIAEQQYMRRKMQEKDFNSFVKEKQRQLIELEALIDEQYNKQKGGPVSEEILAVQAKKRHILQGLLTEKQRLVKELSLAENTFLRRKIDSATYQSIAKEKQQKLIGIEAQIKQIYAEANVSKVMDNLRQRLAAAERESKENRKKGEKSDREKELQIAREIVEQLEKEEG